MTQVAHIGLQTKYTALYDEEDGEKGGEESEEGEGGALKKKQDEEEYQRCKEDLEVRALRAEIDANEDQALQLESADVISMLEAKLNALLSGGGQVA